MKLSTSMDVEEVSAHMSCSKHWTRDLRISRTVTRLLSVRRKPGQVFNASFDHEDPQSVSTASNFNMISDEPIYRAWSTTWGKNVYKWAMKHKNWVVGGSCTIERCN